MSRKDFEAVAAAIKTSLSATHDILDEDRRVTAGIAVREVANSLCDVFAAENPRFDRNRFLAACGIVK